MEHYLLEAALLMLAAYLLGAVIGCFARRTLTSQEPAAKPAPAAAGKSMPSAAAPAPAAVDLRDTPEPVQPRIETVAQPTPPENTAISESARFERVLTSPPASANDPGSAASAAAATGAAAVTAATVAATHGTANYSEDNVPTEPVTQPLPPLDGPPEPAAPATGEMMPSGGSTGGYETVAKSEGGSESSVPLAGVVSGAAAAAAAAAAATAAALSKSEPEPEVRFPSAGGSTGTNAVAAPLAASSPEPLAADDLRKIDGVDDTMASQLNQLGYTRFSDIAGWTADDTARVRRAFGDDRAHRGSWIEQAKMLADGKTTAVMKQHASGIETVAAPADPLPTARPLPTPPAASAPDTTAAAAVAAAAAATAAAAAKSPAPAAASAPASDDLTRIQGIDGAVAAALAARGVTSFAQIAGWTAEDVARIDGELGQSARVSRENWIEQAKMLASGKASAFGRRVAAGEIAADTPHPTWSRPVHTLAPARSAAAAPAPAQPAPATAAAAATAAALAAATASPQPAPAAAEVAKPVADDLTRIQGIDGAVASALAARGITSFAQIAGWTAADVSRIDGELGQSARASRENWIEQAKMLSSGKATHFARRVGRGEIAADSPHPTWSLPVKPPITAFAPASATPASVAPAPASQAPVAAVAASAASAATAQSDAAAPVSDSLKRIAGVGDYALTKLTKLGIVSYAQIARWTADDVSSVERELGQPGRITRENWIEQAKMLSDGKDTSFANRLAAGQAQSVTNDAPPNYRPGSIGAAGGVATAPFEGPPAAPDAATAGPAPNLDEVPVSAMASVHAGGDEAAAPSSSSTAATPVDEAAPEAPAAPAATVRPARLADAIRQNTGAAGGSAVAGMRSVRSQLLTGPSEAPAGGPDDLKKIRGIGVLIEKKLNAMGVFKYEQIAHWTASDIERVSSTLDFKGRIEREGWVQQARILASGGQTEFSKRLT